jgi:hypothetical protein
LDLHTCWRIATGEAKEEKNWSHLLQAKRRENATWRRFFQEKWKLKKCNPYNIRWNRECDENRFYAPFYPNSTTVTEEEFVTTPVLRRCLLKPALKRTKPHLLPYLKVGCELRKIASDTFLAEQRRSPVPSYKGVDYRHCTSPKEVIIKYFEQPLASCSSISSRERKIRFDFEEPKSRSSIPVDIGLSWKFEETIEPIPQANLNPNEKHIEVDLDQILESICSSSNSDSETLLSRESYSPIPTQNPCETAETQSPVLSVTARTRDAKYRQSAMLGEMENDTCFLSCSKDTKEIQMEKEVMPELVHHVTDSMLYESLPKLEHGYKEMPNYNNQRGIFGVLSFGYTAASLMYQAVASFSFG